LLNEFLNFCVALTKETHLSHVVILTSNTTFLNQIYNNSKLKKTSEFKLIDHLEYETIKEWLKTKEFNEEDIDLVYEYLGGCAVDIKKLLEKYKYFNSIKEYLGKEVKYARSEIAEIMKRKMNDKQREIFKDIIRVIVGNGFYESKEDEKREYLEVIDLMSEKEIFFYDPLGQIVRANSKIYIKAYEKILSNNTKILHNTS